MKIKSIIFLFILMSMSSFAQMKGNTDDLQIKKSLTYFVNSIKSKKIEQAVKCIYPKFFTVMPKEQMTQILEFTYNNPFMKIEVQNLKFGTIEKSELIDGEYFSITNYIMQLKCDASSMNSDMQTKIGTALTSQYGKNNVKYNAKEGVYIVNAPMKACAVSKDRKYWKFVFLEKQNKSKLQKVLPKKILDKI